MNEKQKNKLNKKNIYVLISILIFVILLTFLIYTLTTNVKEKNIYGTWYLEKIETYIDGKISATTYDDTSYIVLGENTFEDCFYRNDEELKCTKSNYLIDKDKIRKAGNSEIYEYNFNKNNLILIYRNKNMQVKYYYKNISK